MQLHDHSLGEEFRTSCFRNPDQIAYVFSETGQAVTYRELWYRVARCAKALVSLGLNKGDHIGIWANNCPQWIDLIFAASRLGLVIVTFNTAFKTVELDYQIRHSDIKVLFFQRNGKNNSFFAVLQTTLQLNEFGSWNNKYPFLQSLVCLENSPDLPFMDYDTFLHEGEQVPEETVSEREEAVDNSDILFLLYTSGTTGRPKGALLTHHNIVNNALDMAEGYALGPGDSINLCLPVFHSFALTSMILSILTNTCLIIQELFSPAAALYAMAQYEATYFLGVPTMYTALTNSPDIHKYNLKHLKTAIVGGAPCPEQLAINILDKLGASDTRVGFGITECSPYCFVTEPEDTLQRRLQTVGRVRHNCMEARIVGADSKELPRGEVGEIVIKGYNVMKGYYKNDAATAAVIDKDGWFHTGDLASMDVDGYIQIKDRLSDMIIRGGENVYPAEVEAILATHPKVKLSGVVGIPDDFYGEEVFAFIILRDCNDITVELKEYVRDNLSHFKRPKHFVMLPEFPINASGKVEKVKLREMAKAYVSAERK